MARAAALLDTQPDCARERAGERERVRKRRWMMWCIGKEATWWVVLEQHPGAGWYATLTVPSVTVVSNTRARAGKQATTTTRAAFRRRPAQCNLPSSQSLPLVPRFAPALPPALSRSQRCSLALQLSPAHSHGSQGTRPTRSSAMATSRFAVTAGPPTAPPGVPTGGAGVPTGGAGVPIGGAGVPIGGAGASSARISPRRRERRERRRSTRSSSTSSSWAAAV
jgi:hypothetical protein